MAELATSVKISLLDNITAPVKKVNGALQSFRSRTASLHNKLATVQAYKKSQAAIAASTKQYMLAQEQLKELQSQLNSSTSANSELSRKYGAQVRQLQSVRSAHQDAFKQYSKNKQTLRAMGVDVRNLTHEYQRMSNQVRIAGTLKKYGSGAVDGIAGIGKRTAVTTAAVYAPLGAGAYAFKNTFLATAIEFERYQTILETVEGSSHKAKRSMAWVQDFAVKTPYELDELTDSFVKLRAYGLDPIQGGLLTTLGDTASAMGKPIMQAVEAIADAVTGENERLKEFGIKASASGDSMAYNYTNAQGKQQQKVVSKSDRQAIQKALQAIWNEKFAGAMNKQSKTFAGMLSNLSDQWTRFQMLVMRAGVFDWMKQKLKGVLDTIDALSKSGQLQSWAKQTAQEFIEFGRMLWQGTKALFAILRAVYKVAKSLADFVGGWQNLVAILIVAKAAIGALSIAQLALGIIAVAKALGLAKIAMLAFNLVVAANPIVWIVAAITAAIALAVGGVYILCKNWEYVKQIIGGVVDKIKQVTSAVRNSWFGKTLGLNDSINTEVTSRTDMVPIQPSGHNHMTVDVHDNRTELKMQNGAGKTTAQVAAHPKSNEGYLLPAL